jgi:hypothetical protein
MEWKSVTVPNVPKAPANPQHQSNPDTEDAIAMLKIAARNITIAATSS